MLAERVAVSPCAAALLALPRLSGGREALEEAAKVARRHGAARRPNVSSRSSTPPRARPRAVPDRRRRRGARVRVLHGHDVLRSTRTVPASRSARAVATTSCSLASARRWPPWDSGSTSTRSRGRSALRERRRSPHEGRRLRGRVRRRRGWPRSARAASPRSRSPTHDAALAHARSWRFHAVWSGTTLFDVEARPQARSMHRVTPIAPQASSRAC